MKQLEDLGSCNPAQVEAPEFGGYRLPQRYIVGWPDGVVKIGLTWNGKRRWGVFTGRGGTLLELATYRDKYDALSAEMWLLNQVGETYPLAFSTKDESQQYLRGAGGWMECYRIPTTDWPALLELAVS